MCDQDHFENDRQRYEALGLVTRKQFGMMLGAGMAMMLPKVANAVAVTESDVSVMTLTSDSVTATALATLGSIMAMPAPNIMPNCFRVTRPRASASSRSFSK